MASKKPKASAPLVAGSRTKIPLPGTHITVVGLPGQSGQLMSSNGQYVHALYVETRMCWDNNTNTSTRPTIDIVMLDGTGSWNGTLTLPPPLAQALCAGLQIHLASPLHRLALQAEGIEGMDGIIQMPSPT